MGSFWGSGVPTLRQLLLAQVVEDDPVMGYLLVPDQDGSVLQQQYLVSANGLIAKPAVTLHAVPAHFLADGTSVCTVSVMPFVPCTRPGGYHPLHACQRRSCLAPDG